MVSCRPWCSVRRRPSCRMRRSTVATLANLARAASLGVSLVAAGTAALWTWAPETVTRGEAWLHDRFTASTLARWATAQAEPDTLAFFALVPKLRVWERKHRGEALLRGEGLVEERSAAPATRPAMELPPERCVPKAPLWERG